MRRPRLRFTIGSLMIWTAVLGFLFWVAFGLLKYGREWFRSFPVTVVFTEGRGKDQKSRMILEKLEEPISMSFNEETPLEDILKYIHQATTTASYSGIPIYVDPIGLQEAEKSMTSTVRNIDLEGVPLRRTLQLLLKQLDLAYFVEDGVLYITSLKSMGHFDPTMHEPSPIIERVKKAERGELSPTEMKDLIELLKSQAEARRLAVAAVEGPFDPSVGADALVSRGAARAEKAPERDQSGEKKEPEAARPDREQMSLLLSELRELINVLRSKEQTKNAAGEKEQVR
jgi:hypothetical protein